MRRWTLGGDPDLGDEPERFRDAYVDWIGISDYGPQTPGELPPSVYDETALPVSSPTEGFPAGGPAALEAHRGL